MKTYAYEVLSAAFLVGVIEAYLWTQSRTLAFEAPSTKFLLLFAYLAVAWISEFAISFWLRPNLRTVLNANALVAVIISLGAASLVSSIHAGVIKDANIGAVSFISTSGKFLATAGLATWILRMAVVAVMSRAGADSWGRESAIAKRPLP